MERTASNQTVLRRTSRRLRRIFEIALVVCPLLPLTLYLAYNHLPAHLKGGMLRSFPDLPVSLAWNSRLLLCGAALPSLAVTIVFLLTVRKLCVLYERGVFFDEANVRCYRRLGALLLFKVLAGILEEPLRALALTLNNPPGSRQIAFSLSSGDLQLILGAVVLMLLGRLMEEGRQLQEEADLTI